MNKLFKKLGFGDKTARTSGLLLSSHLEGRLFMACHIFALITMMHI